MSWFPVESVPTEKKARGPVEERTEIDTREGTVIAEPGDYIIMEPDGNRYPIAAEKFEEYYRRIAPEDAAEKPRSDYDYTVPMKDEGNAVAWEVYAEGDTPEEARENALDKYEERYGFRPQSHGEPEPVDDAREEPE